LNKRKTGAQYEQKAGHYLEEKGYRILQYNYRCKCGEIDIVAQDGETIVFCEVKYRSSMRYGSPLAAVDGAKQRVIARCASYYLTEHHCLGHACRFDVIGILPNQIQHVQDAFWIA
jgi:putative endonuclease